MQSTEAELRALLPSPETLLTYADMMLKPYRDIRGGLNQPSEISHACANALRLAALTATARKVCGACGHDWQDGMSCGQKDNGHPFPVCYPADGAS